MKTCDFAKCPNEVIGSLYEGRIDVCKEHAALAEFIDYVVAKKTTQAVRQMQHEDTPGMTTVLYNMMAENVVKK